MKKIKNYLMGIIIFLLLPILVEAGEIRFNHPVRTSNNTYEFTLTVNDIKLNSISGNINVTNGDITKITMENSWINKTGTNNTFYFYRNEAIKGSYKVATIEVTMVADSEYTIHNLDFKFNFCKKDSYGNYFGENGSIVTKSTYDSTCGVSKDATLKSITPSNGNLSPAFNKNIEQYNMIVENSVSTIKFNPVVNNAKSKIISGSTCSLKVGINLCKIVVQAEAGNQKTYTITTTRKNASNNTLSTDASIRNLEVHGGILTKTFNPNTHEYKVKVKNTTKSIYFTYITNSNNKKNTSKSCNITSSTKTCKLIITAEDGVTKNSYLFNIIQDNNTNSNSTSKKEENSGNSNIEVDVENGDTNKKNDSIQNNESMKDQIENKEENQDTIKVPLMDKEISKSIVGKVVAVVDLILGIGIGVFISNRKYKKKSERNKEKC